MACRRAQGDATAKVTADQQPASEITVAQALLLRSNIHQHLLLLRAILAGTV